MKDKVIIIGGGLGGLFTGAILAKEGFEVEVLEKNMTIGGGLQTFSRWGMSFETGMHILGGLRPGGSVHKICSYLGIIDRLNLKDVDCDCTDEIHCLDDATVYRIARGRDGFVDSLASYFPQERDNLRRYVDHIHAMADEVDFFYLRSGSSELASANEDFYISADELIARFTDNEKLRHLLAYMNPLYGGVAGHTPAYIHALINVLYIAGATRFVDSSQQLADALADVIRENGGEVRVNAAVTGIDVEGRRIFSLVDKHGNRHVADHYISAIHPCALLDLLPDGAVTKAYVKRLRAIPNSYSAFTIFLRLKPGGFKYINHTCYCQNHCTDVWRYGEACDEWPIGFMYMTPPVANQGEFAEKMIINSPMPFDMVREWEDSRLGNRPDDYKQWKKEKAEAIIDMMCRIYPDFRDCIMDMETASPLTIRDYYGVKDGAMYGFRKDCKDFMLSQVPPVTKVANLYLTGQNINLHGICGVPLTAVGTAEILLGRDFVINKINQHYSLRYGKN